MRNIYTLCAVRTIQNRNRTHKGEYTLLTTQYNMYRRTIKCMLSDEFSAHPV